MTTTIAVILGCVSILVFIVSTIRKPMNDTCAPFPLTLDDLDD